MKLEDIVSNASQPSPSSHFERRTHTRSTTDTKIGVVNLEAFFTELPDQYQPFGNPYLDKRYKRQTIYPYRVIPNRFIVKKETQVKEEKDNNQHVYVYQNQFQCTGMRGCKRTCGNVWPASCADKNCVRNHPCGVSVIIRVYEEDINHAYAQFVGKHGNIHDSLSDYPETFTRTTQLTCSEYHSIISSNSGRSSSNKRKSTTTGNRFPKYKQQKLHEIVISDDSDDGAMNYLKKIRKQQKEKAVDQTLRNKTNLRQASTDLIDLDLSDWDDDDYELVNAIVRVHDRPPSQGAADKVNIKGKNKSESDESLHQRGRSTYDDSEDKSCTDTQKEDQIDVEIVDKSCGDNQEHHDPNEQKRRINQPEQKVQRSYNLVERNTSTLLKEISKPEESPRKGITSSSSAEGSILNADKSVLRTGSPKDRTKKVSKVLQFTPLQRTSSPERTINAGTKGISQLVQEKENPGDKFLGVDMPNNDPEIAPAESSKETKARNVVSEPEQPQFEFLFDKINKRTKLEKQKTTNPGTVEACQELLKRTEGLVRAGAEEDVEYIPDCHTQ